MRSLLDQQRLPGDEAVLDVGCGRTLVAVPNGTLKTFYSKCFLRGVVHSTMLSIPKILVFLI